MKAWRAIGLAMQLSWTILFSLLLPLLGGIWLDKQLHTTPLFIAVGTVVGVAAATIGVARMVIRMFGREASQEPGADAEAQDKEEAG